MKEVLIMNVIKQMEYTNKMGESLEKLADGVVNGFRFVILSNGVFPIVRIYCDARSQYGEAFQGLATDRAFTSTLMNKRRPRTEVAKSKMGYSMQWNFNKIGDYVGDKEETFVTGRVWNVPDLYAFVVDATEKITFALSGKDLNDVDLDETLEVVVDADNRYTITYRGFNVVRGNVRTCYNTLMSISSVLFSVVKAKGFNKYNNNKNIDKTETVVTDNDEAINDISDIKTEFYDNNEEEECYKDISDKDTVADAEDSESTKDRGTDNSDSGVDTENNGAGNSDSSDSE